MYDVVLKKDTRSFQDLYGLGLVRLQQNRFGDAVELFRRAVRMQKRSAEAHHCLAAALSGAGRPSDAIQHYKKALAIRPNFAEAHSSLGFALQILGRNEEAVASYKQAIVVNEAFPDAYKNLGNALAILGRWEEAITHYEKALALNAGDAFTYIGLGNVLAAAGRHAEAILQHRKALAIRSDIAEAYNSLGHALGALGEHEEAIAQHKAAIAIRSTYFEARLELGDQLRALGRNEEALTQYEIALAQRPDHVELLIRCGITQGALKQFDRASATFERALSLAHDNDLAFVGLARSTLAGCDLLKASKLSQEIAVRVATGKSAIQPFTFLAYCGDPSLQLACAKAHIGRKIPSAPPRLWNGETWRNRKIRVAYLASGFHEHPIAYLTVNLFELHDRSKFEVVGLSLGPNDGSEIRARLVRAFDELHDVRSTSSIDVAKLLRDRHVDILVDVSGYTNFGRPEILAYRPAPIQVSYIGYPGTLGAEFYDYVIADPVVLPFTQQPFYTEKIVHLPETYLPSDSKRMLCLQTPSKKDMGLPGSGFVFCCFNANYKITDQVFRVWMRLLRAVPESVLWLYRSNAVAETNLRKAAVERGVDADRLVFAGKVNLQDHLSRHQLADVFLDTVPYNAHTTASNALWMGLPVITCIGGCFAARVAASLLHAAGLPELVTNTLEEYEALALRLARDELLLRQYRERLTQNQLSYPFFDTDRYRRHIESAYTTMWELWQRGERPRSFAVEPLEISPS